MLVSTSSATVIRTKVQVILANVGYYTALFDVVKGAITSRGRYFAIECVRSTLNPLHQDRLSGLVFGLNDSLGNPLRGVGARLIPKSVYGRISGCGGWSGDVWRHLVCTW